MTKSTVKSLLKSCFYVPDTVYDLENNTDLKTSNFRIQNYLKLIDKRLKDCQTVWKKNKNKSAACGTIIDVIDDINSTLKADNTSVKKVFRRKKSIALYNKVKKLATKCLRDGYE